MRLTRVTYGKEKIVVERALGCKYIETLALLATSNTGQSNQNTNAQSQISKVQSSGNGNTKIQLKQDMSMSEENVGCKCLVCRIIMQLETNSWRFCLLDQCMIAPFINRIPRSGSADVLLILV